MKLHPRALAHTMWQWLPRDARREALFSAMAALAPHPSRPAPAPTGPVIVAGFHGAATGLGAACRRLCEGLREAGIPALASDLTAALRQTPRLPNPPASDPIPPGAGTLLVQVNGPMFPWALRALGARAVAGKRVIGIWNWELPVLPQDWNRGYGFLHQIWVPSQFNAEAVRRPAGPGAVTPPVVVVPNHVPIPAPATLDRAAFGLPAEAFVALCIFDAASSIARKNPQAAIMAHRAAFGDDPNRILLLKTHATRAAGPAWEEVARMVAGAPNIRILDAALPRADLWALQAAADVTLSLHRAEGFGYVIAEAMALGRAVVATGWSGNMDFMHGPGTFAVPYRLVPAEDPQRTYHLPATHWAEADTVAAAAQLRRLAATPSLCRPQPHRFAPIPYAERLGLGAKHPAEP